MIIVLILPSIVIFPAPLPSWMRERIERESRHSCTGNRSYGSRHCFAKFCFLSRWSWYVFSTTLQRCYSRLLFRPNLLITQQALAPLPIFPMYFTLDPHYNTFRYPTTIFLSQHSWADPQRIPIYCRINQGVFKAIESSFPGVHCTPVHLYGLWSSCSLTISVHSWTASVPTIQVVILSKFKTPSFIHLISEISPMYLFRRNSHFGPAPTCDYIPWLHVFTFRVCVPLLTPSLV